MSEMASWFKIDGGFVFLTDDDVLSYHEQRGNKLENINWNDFVGHGGLMKVYNIPDRHFHHEGFVKMPDVIRKCILDGKMDKLFAHAGNLNEATPEFIPLMRRLASRYKNVREQLETNPYVHYEGTAKRLSNVEHMKVGIKGNFQGSTIGELLREDTCYEDSMLLALKNCRDYMDKHSDHHHYIDIIDHYNVTAKVLGYIIKNIKHRGVRSYAKDRLRKIKTKVVKKKMQAIKNVRIKTLRRGKAKVRITVPV